MIDNPYQPGESTGQFENDSTGGSAPEPFSRRFVRGLGLAKWFEAGFQVVLLLGSIWAVLHVVLRLPAGAGIPRTFQAYLGERFVVLPALIGLNVYLARGLVRLRRREVTIMAIFAVTVVLFLAGKSWMRFMDVRFDFEEPDTPPVMTWLDVAWLLLDLAALVCHAAFSIVLFRARKTLAGIGDGPDSPNPGWAPGFLSQLAAPAAALMLLVGSLVLLHDLSWELARQVFLFVDSR
jgi:hypothetical protein